MLLLTKKIIIENSTNQVLLNLNDKSLMLQVNGLDVTVKSSDLDTILTFQSNNEAVEFVNDVYKKINFNNKLSFSYRLLKRTALVAASFSIVWLSLNIVSLLVVSNSVSNQGIPPQVISSIPDTSNTPILPNSAQPIYEPDQVVSINVAELSAGLKKGIATGDYAVNLSDKTLSDSTPALFVFADPLCPHCQDAEPTLRELAKEIPVYIFPVSLIGNAESEKIVVPILCKRDLERTNAWISQKETERCEDGLTALNTNNTFFRAAKFEGTPTLVASDGRIYNYANPFTVDALKKWVNK